MRNIVLCVLNGKNEYKLLCMEYNMAKWNGFVTSGDPTMDCILAFMK